MKKFPWGRAIEHFEYDFDGKKLEVTKYEPPNVGGIQYHCAEISESFNSIDELLIGWLAFKHLGLNQRALAQGICRALELYK